MHVELDKVIEITHRRGWIINPIDEGPMKRINNFPFYKLGAALQQIEDLTPKTTFLDALLPLIEAEGALRLFLSGKDTIPLSFSRPDAEKLRIAIRDLTPAARKIENLSENIGQELYGAQHQARVFQHVLAAELEQLDTYFVPQVGIYSTNALMERADDYFLDKRFLNDQVKIDFREAGKCLACQIPTAAGFHIWRATESLIVDYFKIVIGREPKDSERNWGKYAEVIRENGGDEKVCTTLDQIRKLHRNPINHPEVNLTMNEATSLLGIAQTAITAMQVDIEKRQPPTTQSAIPAKG